MSSTESTIRGVVKDSNGKAVAGARVSFIEGPLPLPDIAALTDKKGAFSLFAPVFGHYVIEIFADNFSPKRLEVVVRKKQVDVKIEL